MATVSTVPGVIDKRQGWSGPGYSPEEQAAYKARQEAGRPRHPSEIKAEQAQREVEREAERRAATPDPRGSLRDAHTRRAEAQAELDRIVGLRGRANDLVAALEARHTELVDLVRAGNKAAAAELVGALGDENQSCRSTDFSPNEQLQDQLESVSGRLGVARDALQQLSEERRRAVAAMRESETGVEVAAVAVAIDHCVAEGEAIAQLQAELHRRRSDLYSLTAGITSELRRLPYVAGLYLPPAVGRALGAIDSKVDPVWSARLKALHQDPEAEL